MTLSGKEKAEDKFIRMPALNISVGHLFMIFRNLMENAIKYCDKGMRPQVDISWTMNGKFVVFRFKDNGIGIPSAERHLVGREGFRGRQAQELQLRGNGLGLAVCQTAIRSWGGTLELGEAETQCAGSAFVLTVPTR